MYAAAKECTTYDDHKGLVDSVGSCGTLCKEEASMFVFGTQDYGGSSCERIMGQMLCNCSCEWYATDQGTCTTKDNPNVNLYRYLGMYVT